MKERILLNNSLINEELIYDIQSLIVSIKGFKVAEEEVIEIIDTIPQNIIEICEGCGFKNKVFIDEVYDYLIKRLH